MDIIELVKKEIRAWWLTGGSLHELFSLCPEDIDIKAFVASEFISLEMKMKQNPYINSFNAEGPLRLQ